MPIRHRLKAFAVAAVLLLLVLFPGNHLNRALEPLAGSMDAEIPGRGLDITWSPVDTPRQLKRSPSPQPPLVPKARARARGILQKASQRLRTTQLGMTVHAATVRAFLDNYQPYLRLDDPVAELKLQRTFTDALQRTHFRYSQHYHGLPVWPAVVTIHLDQQGNVDLMNGSYIPTPRAIGTHPSVQSDAALAAARATVPRGDQAPVDYHALIIYAPARGAARLAWKFRLNAALDQRWVVVIDAGDQSVLTRYNEVKTLSQVTQSSIDSIGQAHLVDLPSLGAVSGSGVDLFGRTRPLSVWQDTDGRFYMIDTSKRMFTPNPFNGFLGIYDAVHQTSGTFYPVSSSQSNMGWLADGVSAAYNLSKIYDYYLFRHGRNSLNGHGGNIRTAVRVGQNWNNSVWANEAIYIGDARPYAGALDVVEHEAAHGVNDYSADLIYQDQSGALSESFADIFGQNVEAYVVGSTDWLVGAELGLPMRSLTNPSSLQFFPNYPYPSKMSQYVSGSVLDNFVNRDNGGVHINSSIVNYAYYLLAAGPDGIGLNDAEKIFYRALTVHLTPSSQFLDARLACIQAAEELFGAKSFQAARVATAFDAVEIYDPTVVSFQRSSWKRALAP